MVLSMKVQSIIGLNKPVETASAATKEDVKTTAFSDLFH